MKTPTPRRYWIRPTLWALPALVAVGGAMSYLFFAKWTDVTKATPAEADQIIGSAIAEAGGGTPYIEIAADGVVVVHREQEGSQARSFDKLTLLAWNPADRRMLRVEYPRWFVRLKTSSSLNLGTMIAAARRVWGHLDLNISYTDLLKRGPALLLDRQSEAGARLIIWTSATRDDRRGQVHPSGSEQVDSDAT